MRSLKMIVEEYLQLWGATSRWDDVLIRDMIPKVHVLRQ